MEDLQNEIEKIKERNKRVEADKAWETSFFRIITITVITYILASIVLFIIKVDRPFLNALIPTLGFFFSIQSLPLIKKWWVKKYVKK